MGILVVSNGGASFNITIIKYMSYKIAQSIFYSDYSLFDDVILISLDHEDILLWLLLFKI